MNYPLYYEILTSEPLEILPIAPDEWLILALYRKLVKRLSRQPKLHQ